MQPKKAITILLIYLSIIGAITLYTRVKAGPSSAKCKRYLDAAAKYDNYYGRCGVYFTGNDSIGCMVAFWNDLDNAGVTYDDMLIKDYIEWHECIGQPLTEWDSIQMRLKDKK